MQKPVGLRVLSRTKSKDFWAEGPVPPPQPPEPVSFVQLPPRRRDKGDSL